MAVTYRYWRWHILSVSNPYLNFLTDGELNVQVDEFSLLSGGSRVAGTPTVTQVFPGVIIGHESSPATEDVDKLYDNTTSKWLAHNCYVTLTLDFGADVTADQYRYTTGNDAPERDPNAWIVEGSADNSTWLQLDAQAEFSPPAGRDTNTSAFNLTKRVPVDITDVGSSTPVSTAAGATTVSPTYPSNVVAGVVVYAYVHVRATARTVTTPANWQHVGRFDSGNTSAEAAGAGPTTTHVYRRTATGVLSGSESFTLSAQATTGVAQAYMRAYSAAGTNVKFADHFVGWSDPSAGTGAGSTAPDGSITTIIAGTYANKDILQVSLGINDDDNTAASIGSVTCTGATFGSAVEAGARTVTANGNDLATVGFIIPVTGGTNTGTTLTVPVSQTPANQMHAFAHRIRATADLPAFVPQPPQWPARNRAANY